MQGLLGIVVHSLRLGPAERGPRRWDPARPCTQATSTSEAGREAPRVLSCHSRRRRLCAPGPHTRASSGIPKLLWDQVCRPCPAGRASRCGRAAAGPGKTERLRPPRCQLLWQPGIFTRENKPDLQPVSLRVLARGACRNIS